MNTYERFAKEEVQQAKGMVDPSETVGQILVQTAQERQEVAEESYHAIENGTIKTYKAIENSVVDTYKAIENGVVGAYQKTEDFFVGKFLTRPGETVEDAKKRMQDSVKNKER